MHTFWLLHADAVGVAVIAAGLAAIGWLILDHLYRRALRTEHGAPRTAGLRTSDFDRATTQALALSGPVRTPLTDALALERTVADVPSPYAPAFYDGGAR